jgi:hypothetical protein
VEKKMETPIVSTVKPHTTIPAFTMIYDVTLFADDGADASVNTSKVA